MTYHALLVGNSVFDQDDGLNRLNAPVKDVMRLHRALVDPDLGMFEEENVRVVTEESKSRILEELDDFFEQGRRDDLLLFYYSGHGLLNERNRLFLCARDTRSDRLLRTAVGNTEINDFIEQSMAGTTVVVLDCCSAGMFKAGGPMGDQLAGAGRYVVSSVRGDELANDSVARTGTSLFTEHLVGGLTGGARDVNGDGYVDLREIYDYVRGQLLETSKQRPHCRFDGDGSIRLSRAVRAKPATPEPAPTAPHAGQHAGDRAQEQQPQVQGWPSQHSHPQHGWSVPPDPAAASQAAPPPVAASWQQPSGPASQPFAQPQPQQQHSAASAGAQQAWGQPPGEASGHWQPPQVAKSAQRAVSISIGVAILSVIWFGVFLIPWAYSAISKARLEIERSGGRLSGEAELRVARRCARIATGIGLFWLVAVILSAIYG